jgi:hypothetical protein
MALYKNKTENLSLASIKKKGEFVVKDWQQDLKYVGYVISRQNLLDL